jgi:hypothetical protein
MRNFNSSAFFKVCSGIALVLFAFAAFCFAIRPAHASPGKFPSGFSGSSAATSGKYQFIYNLNFDNNNNPYWHAWVCNTETGAYKAYGWNRDEQKWEKMFDNCQAFSELP